MHMGQQLPWWNAAYYGNGCTKCLAPGYCLWDQLGKLFKKHNNRVGLWRLAWRWKKSDDCPLSETLNAPHFYRRRNHVWTIDSGTMCMPFNGERAIKVVSGRLRGSWHVRDKSGAEMQIKCSVDQWANRQGHYQRLDLVYGGVSLISLESLLIPLHPNICS